MIIHKNIRDNKKLRDSFIDLAIETFDLSFESWYEDGYWSDRYIPYVFLDGEKVVANVSVNIIDTLWNSETKRYIQLGTVMTDTAYRNKGLSKRLIEEILKDWQSNCDAIYLFANDSVLDFYPKFGFVEEKEYQCSMPIKAKQTQAIKLDLSKKEDRALLEKYYKKSNLFSALPMLNNYGLLMFHCSSYLKDCIFYCEEFDAVVLAMQSNETLICYDIYCDNDKHLRDILSTVASKETRNVIFGFSLKDKAECIVEPLEHEDETLFLLESKDNIFAENQLMFPIVSHA